MVTYVLIIKYFELQNDLYMYTVFYYLRLAVYLFLATDIEVLKTDFFFFIASILLKASTVMLAMWVSRK